MKRIVVALLLLTTTSLRAAETLRVIKAGPVGEVAQIAEANEGRVVFSEPMVAVAKIPKNLTIPWFHIAPEVKGTFRWSGTTTLIFTPDPKQALPFATKFDVTVDKTATSLKGNTLDRAYTFAFITPTIQLLAVPWYRKSDRIDSPVVIGLRFNQPVERQTILEHVQLRTKGHEFKNPPAPEMKDPAFDAKRDRAEQAAKSDGAPVFASAADDWDKKRIPPGRDLVVLETKPNVPPDTWIQVYVDSELAQSPANVRSGRVQDFTVKLWPALFVNEIACSKACNPDSQNALLFRRAVSFAEARKAITVVDITDPKQEVPLQPNVKTGEREPGENSAEYVSLDELGYSVLPAHRYRVRVDHSLPSDDGQSLGYNWDVTVEYWHRTAFTSFGDGHGVWESTGGPILPFHSRNFRSIKQWLAPLSLDQLMPTILQLQAANFMTPPPSPAQDRKLAVVPDKIQSFGLDVSPAVGSDNLGLAWVAVQEGEPIAQSRTYGKNLTRATVVQVTNLGISVKDSPLNTVVMVTRLDNAAPVAGATVSIRTTDNKVFWSGPTDANGIVTIPNTNLRLQPETKKDTSAPAPDETQSGTESDEYENSWDAVDKLHFIVTAEKDGDVAYVASDWHNGITPWEFSVNFNLNESHPLLRGTMFTDRGVYKLGEEVHVKAVIRSDTPTGLQLLPAGTKIEAVIRDSHDKELDKRTVALNEWSSAEWTWKLPDDVPLGTYRLIGRIEGQRLRTYGEFLVAAYRRPEFRVDAALTGPTTVSGVELAGQITGRYLFGAPMS
ncbi:MAG: MG2 domain-containing protein, partial [Thermoanaerobaculia bacterium]